MKNPSTLLVVNDLQESKLFYVNILGLDFISESDSCVKLLAGSHEIIMFQGALPAMDYKHGYNASSTLVFTVENLDEKIKQLKSLDVDFIHHSPNQNEWGRYSAFKDPSEIVHELFEFFG